MLNSSSPITLCMIVKNEGHVIERCLATVKPHVDRWLIVDTGSTDDTIERIVEALDGIRGEVHELPWKNFGHNRSESLELARKFAKGEGYLLVIDADDTLDVPDEFECPLLDLDAYTLRHTMENIEFRRAQLFSAAKPWKYVGVVHEHPSLGVDTQAVGSVEGVTIRIGQDGARRLGDATSKYLADVMLLEEAVAEDPADMRSLFYLAQSYRDAGEFGPAYHHYKQRAESGGWEEEQWYALYQSGLMANVLGNTAAALEALQKAFKQRPERREPVVAMALLYRNQENWAMARLWSHYAVHSSSDLSNEQLFIEPACHGGWRALDELSLATFYGGQRAEATLLFERLLRDPKVPEMERARIRQNLSFLVRCPESKPYKLALTPVSDSLETMHARYTTEISTAMAMSLETSTFLARFAKQESIQAAIDLGSGLSSGVLRLEIPEVTSIDIEVEWLEKTRGFLAGFDLDGEHRTLLWSEFSQEQNYQLVVLDLGDSPERAQYLPTAWQLLVDGGWLFIDDMHHWPYRRQVERFLTLVDHQRFDVHEHTLDSYGRYGWLIRKLDAADAAA